MEAGRRRGYHDNEFMEQESEYELSMKESVISKHRHGRIGNGSRDRVRVHDLKGMVNGRGRQREVGNGLIRHSSRSVSGRSSSGSGNEHSGGLRQCDFVAKAVDREPGELSSDSGSDGTIETESQVKKDSEVSKAVENGMIRDPVEKKRKFSPIVWDRDDRKVSNSSKVSVSHQVVASLPPRPSVPKLQHELVGVTVEETVGISSTGVARDQNKGSSSPIENPVAKSLAEPESRLELVAPTSVPEEHQLDKGLKSETLEDDYVPTRHISSSRWATGSKSPLGEGEILEEEEMPKRKKKVPDFDSSGSRMQSKSVTPEGDLKREGSERAKSPTSNDLGFQAESSSEDGHPINESERDEYMEVDGDHRYNNRSTDSDDDNDSQETPEPAGPPQRSVNMLRGCRSVDEFERLNKIDEGTYGVVYRAKDRITGEIVALKKVKMEKEREGFPLTALREMNILLSFHHPSIVDVKEVVVGSSLDSIFMVMEYMEHDLKALMESMKQPFSQSEVKCLMLQLLDGTKYLHDNWVLHRDLKTSNLLLNNRGELKICDFGLARQYGSPLKPYTHMVVTLWYRAPELLLGAQTYSTAIDMWSLGCIMAELLSKKPLFNGKTEFDQLDKIFRTLGTPNEAIWPGFSKLSKVKVNFVKHQLPAGYNLLRKKFPPTSFTGSPVLSDSGFDLLNKLLTYDPEKRISAYDALNHEWFREVPLPKSKDFMPTFPAQHAQDRRARRILKSPDPLEEQRKKELRQAELGTGGLFG